MKMPALSERVSQWKARDVLTYLPLALQFPAKFKYLSLLGAASRNKRKGM